MSSVKPVVLLESYTRNRDRRSFAFAGMERELLASRPAEVIGVLAEVEKAVAAGLHAVGFLSYECAPGFDEVLVTREPADLPLAWFGLFRERHEVRSGTLEATGEYAIADWQPSISRDAYLRGLQRIKEHLAVGDTYQVNYTFRLRAAFSGDSRTLYRDLCQSQRASFCAYLDLGRHCLMSASPELFFALRDGRLTTRPMKGTRPRGRWPEEDIALALELGSSPKDRAENVMIVDLLRNDLARVSAAGSVVVPRLWEMERYETVWQLTSTIESRFREEEGLVGLFGSLFPCGSITGAPKARTMEIIAALEDGPRGPYTGCIGFVSPGLEAVFNVAIRTVWLDREQGVAEFGVGGGITWDSSPEGEYAECVVKARVLTERRPVFQLLETMLFAVGKGYYLVDRHMARLSASAAYFGFSFDLAEVRGELDRLAGELGDGEHRVRLLLARNGEVELQHAPLQGAKEKKWKVVLADEPVVSQDPFLFHKTTHRSIYERRLASRPDCDDVVLRNEREEVTECCLGNLVAQADGECWTPPVGCGLLAGTFRAELLERGEIGEKVLKIEDLRRAERLFLINSVRRWVECELVE